MNLEVDLQLGRAMIGSGAFIDKYVRGELKVYPGAVHVEKNGFLVVGTTDEWYEYCSFVSACLFSPKMPPMTNIHINTYHNSYIVSNRPRLPNSFDIGSGNPIWVGGKGFLQSIITPLPEAAITTAYFWIGVK